MPKLKRIIVFMVIAGMLTAVPVGALALSSAGTDRPSDWAVEEISDAIENGLVPEELQANYQTNIKRYEYVLLALKVFDKSGKYVNIVNEKPFNDVINHKYEKEIVRAYNAGIVKGDGKGNFFPDAYITRQEIASLVVNLLMQIAPEKDFSVKNSHEYADGDKISDWAKFYIDYCFENKILEGYGNNIIDPTGNATIEQSIALLYRLARNEGLVDASDEQVYGAVDIEDLSEKIINKFTEEYNAETFNIIKEVSEKEDVDITSFNEKSATLSFKYNSISLNSPYFEKNIYAYVHDINEELFVETYKELLLKNFSGGEKGVSLFEQYIEKMKANEIIEVYEQIDETQEFVIQSDKDYTSDKVVYLIGFIQRK